MSDDQRRIARARLLRRTGKTYDEIRAALGVTGISDDRLQSWLRGIPRPPQTRRSHPLPELRRECRRLRAAGHTYSEIAAKTGASKGSISPWVRDISIPSPAPGSVRPQNAALRAWALDRAQLRARKREVDHAIAAAGIGPLDDRELFLAGVALYWAEGSKSKSYALRERMTFVNSDPTVIVVYMRWLALLGIPLSRCRFRIAIHETSDVAEAHRYWAGVLGISPDDFQPATIKRHRPATNRLNYGEDYHGCVTIGVLQSAALYRAVAGWWAGLHAQAAMHPRRSPEWGSSPPWLLRRAADVR